MKCPVFLSDNGGRSTLQCTEVLYCNNLNVSLFFVATLRIHSGVMIQTRKS